MTDTKTGCDRLPKMQFPADMLSRAAKFPCIEAKDIPYPDTPRIITHTSVVVKVLRKTCPICLKPSKYEETYPCEPKHQNHKVTLNSCGNNHDWIYHHNQGCKICAGKE